MPRCIYGVFLWSLKQIMPLHPKVTLCTSVNHPDQNSDPKQQRQAIFLFLECNLLLLSRCKVLF